MNVLIETYSYVPIYYRKEDGYLLFTFEGRERMVKYLFEAYKIIDEPVWEPCDLDGYYIDGSFHNFIGIAKAIKKDKKSGKPYWQVLGQYDIKLKDPSIWQELIVYPKNEETDKIYLEWKEQRKLVSEAESNLRVVINKLK
jgi:hypothetical protein